MVTQAIRGSLAIALLALWLSGCSSPDVSPTVVGVTPGQAIAGETTVLSVRTTGFAATPTFDLNTGQGTVDDAVHIQLLGPTTLSLDSVLRGTDGVFSGVATPMLSGWYAVDVTDDAGRHARLDHGFQVGPAGSFTGAVLSVDRVTSASSTVYPGQSGVPISVSVRNLGGTAARSVVVRPIFLQGGTNLSSDFYASSPSLPLDTLAPGATLVVPFLVDVQLTAPPGEVLLNATATAVEDTTLRALASPGAAVTGTWTILPGAFDGSVFADATVDTGTDMGTDGGTDVAIETGSDVTLDVGRDAGTDTGMDTGTDVAQDAQRDVHTDLGADGSTHPDATVTGNFEVVSVNIESGNFTMVRFAVLMVNATNGPFRVTSVTPRLYPSTTLWAVNILSCVTLPTTLAPGAHWTVHATATRGSGELRFQFVTFDASATGIDAAGHSVSVPHAMSDSTVLLP